MKNYSKYVVGLIVCLAITSCKKDLIEDPQPDEQPDFKIEGTIGAEPFEAIAGDDGCIMSTFIDQFNHVDLFSGKIASENLEVELGFFNGNIDMHQAFLAEAILQGLSFANQPQTPLLTISKDQFPNSTLISSINWYLDGVNVSQNTITFLTTGKFSVGAKVNFYDGTSATIYNDIIVGFHRNVDFQMRHFLGQNGHLQVWVDEYSEEVNSVKWYFDGMLVSTEEKLDTIVNAFGHKIEAEIVFENGAKRKRTIWVDGGLNGKFIDDFASFESNSANVQWDFKPKVTFKKDGKTYTSLTANNQSADFEVMDIAYYSTSSQGKPIYKIQASIDCFVREIASNEVLPLSATLTFAVEFN